jgi:thiamine-phosphate pyrophosphorylase
MSTTRPSVPPSSTEAEPAAAAASAAPAELRFLRLVGITDNLRDGPEGLIARAKAAVKGGVTAIQVRLKDSSPREIVMIAQELVRSAGVPVFVNDRADLALAAGAVGVHLGPDDLPVRLVRRFAPAGFLIGASFGEDSEYANAKSANYAGIGPIARTSSKSDAGEPIGIAGFQKLAAKITIPAVAVGAIQPAMVKDLISAGAIGVAVMSGIFGVSDPERAAAEYLRAIET